MQTLLQPAFILHAQPYRETHALLDVFTHDVGRIRVLARDIRKPKSALKSLLQAFSPLVLSWMGKGDFVTLLAAEASAPAIYLTGKALMSGLYLNELLVRLLGPSLADSALFSDYQTTLYRLQQEPALDVTLRWFEKTLLKALGYELPLHIDSENQPICPQAYYRLDPLQGLFLLQDKSIDNKSDYFQGASLLALDQDEYHTLEQRRDAKRFMRHRLNTHLNGYRLKSLDLWRVH